MMRIPEQQVLLQMKQFFDVKPLSGDVEKLPDDTRVLMVVHPQDLSEKTLYTIDQWVMAGNATMIFVDPVAENQMGPRGGPPPNPTSNLEPLFNAWGVKFDTKRAVGDPDYALQTERNVGGRPVASQNLPWMALRGDALARDEAILAQLSAVVMTTAGAFETTKDGVTLRPLVRASNAAVTLDAAIAGDRSRRSAPPAGGPHQGTEAADPRGPADRHARQCLSGRAQEGRKAEEKKPDEAKPDEAKAGGRQGSRKAGRRRAQALRQARERDPGRRRRHADGPQLDPAARVVRTAGRAGLRQQRRFRHQRHRADVRRRGAVGPARARRVMASVRD